MNNLFDIGPDEDPEKHIKKLSEALPFWTTRLSDEIKGTLYTSIPESYLHTGITISYRNNLVIVDEEIISNEHRDVVNRRYFQEHRIYNRAIKEMPKDQLAKIEKNGRISKRDILKVSPYKEEIADLKKQERIWKAKQPEFLEETVNKIAELGYEAIVHKKHEVYEDAMIIWLKNKPELIRPKLEDILLPIMQRIAGVDAYEFCIFTPFENQKKATYPKTKEELLEYNPVRETITLKTIGNTGIVDLNEILEIYSGCDHYSTIGLSSRVHVAGNIFHIPQIDFNGSLREARCTLTTLGKHKEHLAYTGNSFHHHDTSTLLTEGEFNGYMNSLMRFECIGEIWPGLQQLQGHSLLRILPGKMKYNFIIYLTGKNDNQIPENLR